MLVAEKLDGTLFSLIGQYEKSKLSRLRASEFFYCPICKEQVEMRLGERRRWHFAHRAGSACSYLAEAESAYHLEGKRLLYEWLLSQETHPLLEPYLQSLKQRPDLWLPSSSPPVALEFQCATLSPELMTKRTTGFQQAGILPIWILGGNRLKRISQNVFQFSQMDWLAVREAEPHSFHLQALYFCPETKQFASLTNLMPYSHSKALADLRFYPPHSVTFSKLIHPPVSQSFCIPPDWMKVKQHWRLHPARFPNRTEKYIGKIYGSLSALPPAAGWPTPSVSAIETPCLLWQSWLFHRFITTWPSYKTLDVKQVFAAFRQLVDKKVFQIRKFPLISGQYEKRAIHEYLKCLVALGFLRQVGREQFRRQAIPQKIYTMDDLYHFDSEYFEKLSRII